MESKIIYFYNHEDWLHIQRLENGEWTYQVYPNKYSLYNPKEEISEIELNRRTENILKAIKSKNPDATF